MPSVLDERPYDRGFREGKMIARKKIITKVLTKRFGELPEDVVVKINSAEIYQFDLIVDNLFNAQSLDDVIRCAFPD